MDSKLLTFKAGDEIAKVIINPDKTMLIATRMTSNRMMPLESVIKPHEAMMFKAHVMALNMDELVKYVIIEFKKMGYELAISE